MQDQHVIAKQSSSRGRWSAHDLPFSPIPPEATNTNTNMTLILNLPESMIYRFTVVTCELLDTPDPQQHPEFESCRREVIRASLERGLSHIEKELRGQEKPGSL
jgi:hypothetical protein